VALAREETGVEPALSGEPGAPGRNASCASPTARMKPVFRTRVPPFSGTVNRVNTKCAPTERAAVWNCTARSTTPLRATGSPSIPPKKPSGLITLTCQCSARTATPERPGAVMRRIFPGGVPGNRRFGRRSRLGTGNDGAGWYQ